MYHGQGMQSEFDSLLGEGLASLQQDNEEGWFDTVVDGHVDQASITEFRWAIEVMYNGIQDLLAKADDTAKSLEERRRYVVES